MGLVHEAAMSSSLCVRRERRGRDAFHARHREAEIVATTRGGYSVRRATGKAGGSQILPSRKHRTPLRARPACGVRRHSPAADNRCVMPPTLSRAEPAELRLTPRHRDEAHSAATLAPPRCLCMERRCFLALQQPRYSFGPLWFRSAFWQLLMPLLSADVAACEVARWVL